MHDETHDELIEDGSANSNGNGMDMNEELRTVRLFGDVNNEMDYTIWAGLKMLEAQSSSEPITILLNSPGGSIISMLSIVDAIQLCTCPICIIGTGCIMSAAVPILATGTVGYRYLAPRTRLLLHPPRVVLAGLSKNVENGMKETQILHKMYNDILLQTTKMDKLTVHKYTNNMEDNFFSASMAVKLGIADKVLRRMP